MNYFSVFFQDHDLRLAGVNDNLQSIENRFTKRWHRLQEQCKLKTHYEAAQNSELAVKEHLTIDQKHNLVYCAIEKVGCTFWKRVFQILSGSKNVSNPFHIQGIRAYEGYLTAKGMSFDKIHMILKSSTKFIFVREPYERMFSGYVDKLFSPNAAYWNYIGTFITNSFRKNATEISKKCGHDVTFEEFIRYFLHSQATNEKRDAHFVPHFEHCRPCELDYDYIGKLESFEEDTLYLLKKFNLDKLVKFDNFEKETEMDAIVDAVDYVYSMRGSITRCMSMREALLRAYRKLQIRGLISKEIPFPFSGKTSQKISRNQFKQALLKAYEYSGSSKTRKVNRKEAFIEAYSTLPPALMDKLKRALSVDTHLFGYETFPAALRNEPETWQANFRYFKL